MTATIISKLETYTHQMQPYGWVEMVDCVVEQRVELYPDYRSEYFPAPDRPYGYAMRESVRTYVRGTVLRSSYCGALLCGVPMVRGTSDRYPVGSTHECQIRDQSDLIRHETIDVAM